jgi:hypothetical protein
MLTHIVVWKYKPETSDPERAEHSSRSRLRALFPLIPEVRSLTVGRDVLHLTRSYDTGLVATFDDRAGLGAYTVHPTHEEVAAMGRNISQHVASVDFEDE